MIFIMRGTSCSGKDTFISKYFEPHTVLSSDWYRRVLTNEIGNQQQNGLVFDLIYDVLEKRLKNRLPYTVMNSTNLKMKDASRTIEMAKQYGEKVTVISIDPPELKELVRRSTSRGESGGLFVPEEVLERHWRSYYNSLLGFMEAEKNSFGQLNFIRMDQEHNLVSETVTDVRNRMYLIERGLTHV